MLMSFQAVLPLNNIISYKQTKTFSLFIGDILFRFGNEYLFFDLQIH